MSSEIKRKYEKGETREENSNERKKVRKKGRWRKEKEKYKVIGKITCKRWQKGRGYDLQTKIKTLVQWWAATIENLSVKAMRWFFFPGHFIGQSDKFDNSLQILSNESTNFLLDFNLLSDKAIIHKNS
jgi:hypothetical protein